MYLIKLSVLKHSIIHGMHSKDILIASLTYFWSLVNFERDDFILDQCAPLEKFHPMFYFAQAIDLNNFKSCFIDLDTLGSMLCYHYY